MFEKPKDFYEFKRQTDNDYDSVFSFGIQKENYTTAKLDV